MKLWKLKLGGGMYKLPMQTLGRINLAMLYVTCPKI